MSSLSNGKNLKKSKMIVFPHAKINVGLHVTGRIAPLSGNREAKDQRYAKANQGYHEIETILVPVGLYDALEVIPAPDGQMRFHTTGLPLPADSRENLCMQAYNLLCGKTGKQAAEAPGEPLPPVHVHLHKCIPPGSGLGGGSSDAAHMLMLCNQLFQLNLPDTTLHKLASKLGSDCPFFLNKMPMLATGKGDILREIPLPEISNKLAVIVTPPIRIDTADAYSQITPSKPEKPLPELVNDPIQVWQQQLSNDFEPLVFDRYPAIASIKTKLIRLGARYASLSGSGSSVYGLFDGCIPRDKLQNRFPDCQIHTPEILFLKNH